jgi:hypothetical protein
MFCRLTNIFNSLYPYYGASGDWIPVTHPGGALYFYHERLVRRQLFHYLASKFKIFKRIFTDVYMYNDDLREEVLKSAEQLEDELRRKGPLPTAHYDLVLDVVETKDEKIIWQYYYVDHNSKTLFWLEPYDMNDLLRDIPGVKEPGHISE